MKADEILVEYKDLASAFDIIELKREAHICLDVPTWPIDNLQEIIKLNMLCQKQLIVLLPSISAIYECIEAGLRCGSRYPVRSFEMYHILKNLGISSVRIAAPLTHSLDYFAKQNDDIQIRVTVNDAGGIKGYWDGVKSGWFRPEDIEALESYVDICEFDSENSKQERALYRVYADEKTWAGSINLLVHNLFKDNILNLALPEDFFARRANCGQKCLCGGFCHYCNLVTTIAERDYLKQLDKNIKEMKENG